MLDESRHLDLLGHVLDRCRAEGATAADAMMVESTTQSVRVRLGDVDQAKRARGVRLGVRVFMGARTALSSTNDLSPGALARLVADTCAYARVTAEDPAAGLPDAAELGGVSASPVFDERALDFPAEEAVRLARAAEEVARGADPRITNSEGAAFSSTARRVSLGNTLGFRGSYLQTSFGLYAEPVAEQDGQKEVDYWHAARVRFADMPSPESIGRHAAARTLRRLGARKIETGRLPIVFEPLVAGRLLGHLASALDGTLLYRQASYLAGRLGSAVAAPSITIVDDPCVPDGLESQPFDGDGLATRRSVLVEGGVLRSYLLDTYTARKLGTTSTRAAQRSASGAPSPGATNLRLEPGSARPEEIVRGLKRGLVVTGLLGFGVNLVTGDFSQGATGLLVEDGEVVHAVAEVTIAGRLDEMLRGIQAVGDDLDPHLAPAAPTLLIDGMTVAGR